MQIKATDKFDENKAAKNLWDHGIVSIAAIRFSKSSTPWSQSKTHLSSPATPLPHLLALHPPDLPEEGDLLRL